MNDYIHHPFLKVEELRFRKKIGYCSWVETYADRVPMKMKATNSFETSITTCPATQRHISNQIHSTKLKGQEPTTRHHLLVLCISHTD